jgi:hypothetical protein
LTGFLESLRSERFHLKTRITQDICGALDGAARFPGHWSASIVFEIADPGLSERCSVDGPYRDRSGIGIAIVRTCDRIEYQLKVSHGASHRPDDAEQGKGTD